MKTLRQVLNAMFSERWIKWTLLIPAIMVLATFAVYPTIYAVRISLQRHVLTSPWPVTNIGLGNYRDVLSDPLFWQAFARTALLSVVAIGGEVLLGLGGALVLNRDFRGQGLIRGLCLLPVMASPLAVGLVWRMMYDNQFGVFTFFVNTLGLNVNFLASRGMALWSLIIFDVWQWTPFAIFVFLAGLRGLPKEPFEAAQVDGAPRGFVFRTLTLPMLRPIIFIVVMLRAIWLLGFYDPLFAMTRGGPGRATETVNWVIYKMGFTYFDMGKAATMAIIVLYTAIIISALLYRQLMRSYEELG